MVPVIELRGAIPLGVSLGLHPWVAMIVSIVGNMIPCPSSSCSSGRSSNGCGSICRVWKVLFPGWSGGPRASGTGVHKYSFLGLLLLVAIPLPGTGAWTGALVAALLDMRMRSALPSIFAGVLVAGFLVTGLTFGFTAVFH